MKQGPGVM